MYGKTNGQLDGCVSAWMYVQIVHVCMCKLCECMYVCANWWLDGCIEGWVDEYMGYRWLDVETN